MAQHPQNIFLVIQCIFLIVMGLLTWHLNDYFLTLLWDVLILAYTVYAIILRKYLAILLLLITSAILFPLYINPYTYTLIKSGVIEKKITDKDNTLLIIRFADNSTATILQQGEEKQCIGKEYERKIYCKIILSMLESVVIR